MSEQENGAGAKLYRAGWRTTGTDCQLYFPSKSLTTMCHETTFREVLSLEADADKHKATAQRLHKEGWHADAHRGVPHMERDGLRVVLRLEVAEEMFKIQEASKPADPCPRNCCHPGICSRVAGGCACPQPRWTMTKRQREAQLRDADDLSMSEYIRMWGEIEDRHLNAMPVSGFQYIPNHDCPGMRENGPVVWLVDDLKEMDVLRSRVGDYARLGSGSWYVKTKHGIWVWQKDPGLL